MSSSKPPSHFHRYFQKGVSQDDIEHFSQVTLAQTTLKDPSFEITAVSRTLEHDNNAHTLMAGTWNSPDTIAHLLSFSRNLQDEQQPAEMRRFYTFGSGLNSHPNLLHGGVIATVLDSTMSNTAGLGLKKFLRNERESVVTVQLNVRYQKPVQTPGTVMIKAWVTRVEEGGRKVWVEASATGGEQGEISHAKAEGLWLRFSPPIGKL